MTTELVKATAHENEQAIIACRQNITANSFEIGKRLAQAHDERHWEALGYDSFDQWLADPNGLDLPKSTAYRLMGVSRKFISDMGMSEEQLAGYETSKLEMLVPHVNQENAEEMMGLLSLSRSDMHESLAERFGKQTPRQKRYEAGFNGGLYMLQKVADAFAGDMTGSAENLGWVRMVLWKKGNNFFVSAEK